MSKYVAMVNMAGFMPDETPAIHETKANALADLLEQLENHHDSICEFSDKDCSANYNRAKDELSKLGACYYNGYYYGIEKKRA